MDEIVLADTESGTWLDALQLDANNGPTLKGADNWSITKRTLRGGRSVGVDVVTLDNGRFSVDVLPTRGMGLWRGTCDGIALGWQSPVRLPVHPSLVNLTASGGLGWLGGFNEWVCRCGMASLGPPGVDVCEAKGESTLTLHGAIANTPAHYVAVSAVDEGNGILALQGIVDEATMFGPNLRLESFLSTVAGSNSITIVDEITNLGDQPTEMQLMYHSNFGPPLLEEGARVVTAAADVVPIDAHAARSLDRWDRYPGPTPGVAQDVFMIRPLADELGRATVMLKNAAGDIGASISFPVAELPCLTVWKHPGGANDGYVTGLEPSTSFPNFKTFEREQGRVVELEPGEKYRASIVITVHADAESVAAMEYSINELQSTQSLTLHREPHPEFNPHA